MQFKNAEIILQASQIPDRSRIRKVTGSKEYILRQTLKVYRKGGNHLEVKGCFLMADGEVNQINPYDKLVWLGQTVYVDEMERIRADGLNNLSEEELEQ